MIAILRIIRNYESSKVAFVTIVCSIRQIWFWTSISNYDDYKEPSSDPTNDRDTLITLLVYWRMLSMYVPIHLGFIEIVDVLRL